MREADLRGDRPAGGRGPGQQREARSIATHAVDSFVLLPLKGLAPPFLLRDRVSIHAMQGTSRNDFHFRFLDLATFSPVMMQRLLVHLVDPVALPSPESPTQIA